MHSYSLLIANYGGIMAVPTDPPYCLVYLAVYNNDVEDQNHLNTAASPSGMYICCCICHTLLQRVDKDPVCQRTYEGSYLVIPHRTQYRTLFPEIITPCNHWGPLIDHNTRESYPMATVGDFCLVNPIFHGSPGDSLLFKEDDLDRLKRKGFCVSTYREEKPPPTVPKEDKHRSPHIKENMLSSSHKEEESHKTSGRNSGASSPWVPDSTSSKKSSCQGKHSPPAKEQPDSHDTGDHHSSSSRHKDGSHSEKRSRHSSDKESRSTPCKCSLSSPPCPSSAEHQQKEPHAEESSCIPSESSYTNYRSPSRSMSELKDHRSFTAPTSFSTPNKLWTQQQYQSSSTNSRLSMMPLDLGLYNSFSYSGLLVSAMVEPLP